MSLAEISRKKKTKVDRLKLTMKYSPMVERYLMTHKYETMNNVQGWKMLLTQDTEYQKEVEKRMKAYLQISAESKQHFEQWGSEREALKKELTAKIAKNEKIAAKHIKFLAKRKEEQKVNGEYHEKANFIVSIFNNTANINTEDPKSMGLDPKNFGLDQGGGGDY